MLDTLIMIDEDELGYFGNCKFVLNGFSKRNNWTRIIVIYYKVVIKESKIKLFSYHPFLPYLSHSPSLTTVIKA